MNIGRSLTSLLRRVHRRQWLIVGALALPWAAAAIGVAWRLFGSSAAMLVAVLAATVATVIAYAHSRRFDAAWLTRALDAAVPELEDSSALLMRSTQSQTGLQALQQQRLSARIAHIDLPDLWPPWPRAALALAWMAGGALLALAIADWLPTQGMRAPAPFQSSATRTAAAPIARIAHARITIEPPAYTGLPMHVVESLSARAPAGSLLQWSLQVSPAPRSMHLATQGDKRVPLIVTNGSWQARATLSASILYRVVAADLPALDPRLHRIDAVSDRAPRVRVIAPARTLNIAAPGQRALDLVFEADDDYGLANARLVVTLAQGSGENIGVRTQTLPITGSGPPRRRRFVRSLDLATLGMQAGDDLIVRFEVEDNRKPQAHSARSASVILRWPPPASAAGNDMEGLAQRVLPAYFRSQRQIIIDSEALLKERGALTADRFVQRSDGIGVDQRVLRLRYGQFLGEEAESGSRPPNGSVDAKAAPQESSLFADAHAHEDSGQQADNENESGPATQAEHDHAAPNEAVAAFGDAGAVTAEFGHAHDIVEAATLLDPATQKLLRAALGEMWQAELHLRQGFPDRALPFENRALDLIKQVQQADRIYLAKVGLEMPPIDEARRLTGKRDGLRDRTDALGAAPIKREPLLALWFELGLARASSKGAALESALADAERWLVSQDSPTTETLDVRVAIDAVRLDAACGACRQQLRANLWRMLPKPAANVRRRSAMDADERAYLDALAREPRQ